MLKRFQNSGKGAASSPRTPQPLDYDTLVQALAARANQGASWEQILIYLRNRGLTPDQVAQWMTKYGGRWVTQGNFELGQGLRQLGALAVGELARVATLLGTAIADQQVQQNTPTRTNGATAEGIPDPALDPSANLGILAEVEAYLRGDLSLADVNLDLPAAPLTWMDPLSTSVVDASPPDDLPEEG